MTDYVRRLSLTISRYVTVYFCIALAAAFLTSVTDRFGIWGPPLNPWFPNGVIQL